MLTRRQLLAQTAAAGAASLQAQPTGPRNIAIASANGLKAVDRALEILQAGGDTLDAAVEGVTLVEDDPADNSVGYGGLPNEEGIVELDASVMHGPTRRAGAVGALRNIRNPAKVAKLVMEQTDHIFLVGDEALRFAKAHGFREENLLTESSRLAWLAWKRGLRDAGGHNNWGEGLDAPGRKKRRGNPSGELRRLFLGVSEETIQWALDVAAHPPTGTINCLTLNGRGEMSGVTSTSGLAWKIAGRVGDSPVIGAGLFVDQDVGAAGSTGRGEENLRICGAHTIVECMRHGMSPVEACLEALRRISRNYDDDLDLLGEFDIIFYALRKDGAYGSASLWDRRVQNPARPSPSPWRTFAVGDGSGARQERCAFLYQRK